jgi:hypothetical protein
MLYLYLVVCLGVGVSSWSIRRGWTLVLSLCTIALGVVLNTWRWIDVALDGPLGTLARLAEGTFFYLLPSALIFGVAFLVGRYASRPFIKKA